MMREVMQNAGLEAFAELGLALFFAAFAAAVIRALFMKPDEVEHIEALPLDEGEPLRRGR